MTKERAKKTKEEALAELRQNSVFIMKMKFIREKFWPTLCRVSDSIEDAEIFLSGANTALMQSFLALMKEQKFSEMGLADKIGVDFDKYKELIALFDDMSVFEAKDYIEGMKSEIDLFLKDEQRNRTLDTLKPKWIDEL